MSIITQGYGVVTGAVVPQPPPGGRLATALGRATALIEPWAVVIPDGTLDANDRAALLGQFVGGEAPLGVPTEPAVCSIYGWMRRMTGDPAVGAEVVFYSAGAEGLESTGNLVAGKLLETVITNEDGYFTINLIWTSQLTTVAGSDTTQYKVVCPAVGLNNRFSVPNAGIANLADLLP